MRLNVTFIATPIMAILFAMSAAFVPLSASAQDGAAAESAQQGPPSVIRSIQVTGNQRIEPNTVASYLLFSPGDPYSEVRIDSSIKTLFQTGLFAVWKVIKTLNLTKLQMKLMQSRARSLRAPVLKKMCHVLLSFIVKRDDLQRLSSQKLFNNLKTV